MFPLVPSGGNVHFNEAGDDGVSTSLRGIVNSAASLATSMQDSEASLAADLSRSREQDLLLAGAGRYGPGMTQSTARAAAFCGTHSTAAVVVGATLPGGCGAHDHSMHDLI